MAGASERERRTSRQAEPAAEDARKLERAPQPGSKAVGLGQGSPQAQAACGRAPAVASQSHADTRYSGGVLPALRNRRLANRPETARDLRPDRNPRDQTGCDEGDLARRCLP